MGAQVRPRAAPHDPEPFPPLTLGWPDMVGGPWGGNGAEAPRWQRARPWPLGLWFLPEIACPSPLRPPAPYGRFQPPLWLQLVPLKWLWTLSAACRSLGVPTSLGVPITKTHHQASLLQHPGPIPATASTWDPPKPMRTPHDPSHTMAMVPSPSGPPATIPVSVGDHAGGGSTLHPISLPLLCLMQSPRARLCVPLR